MPYQLHVVGSLPDQLCLVDVPDNVQLRALGVLCGVIHVSTRCAVRSVCVFARGGEGGREGGREKEREGAGSACVV